MAAGGAAAGGAAAGGSAGGAAAGGVAGPGPVWQQPVHGFSGFTLDTGCVAMVDAANGNQLNGTVVGTVDSEDSASGDVRDAGFLPTTFEGAVKGKLRLAARPQLAGNLPFMEYSFGQSTNVHLQLAITPAGALQVSNTAGTVSDNAVTNTYAVDGGFGAGDYLFEVRWARGGNRRVWMNTRLLGTVALPATGANPTLGDRFRVGIMRLDGTDGGPAAVSVRAWQLGERENSTLGDLP